MQFIPRNFTRTEHDDFVLQVQPKLDSVTEAVPILSVDEDSTQPTVTGWKIQNKYE